MRTLVIACVLAGAAPAAAEDPGRLPPALGVTESLPIHALSGYALDGLDPVSYFLPGGPRAGRPEHEILWQGAAWRFVSASNRAAFEAGPERFTPRLGGHDPVALADGRLADGRPDLWSLVGDRLYLFHDPQSLARFAAEPQAVIAAETAWTEARRALVDPNSGR